MGLLCPYSKDTFLKRIIASPCACVIKLKTKTSSDLNYYHNIVPYLMDMVQERSVLVGKDILIKFKPKSSIIVVNKSLARFIANKDLLFDTYKLENLSM